MCTDDFQEYLTPTYTLVIYVITFFTDFLMLIYGKTQINFIFHIMFLVSVCDEYLVIIMSLKPNQKYSLFDIILKYCILLILARKVFYYNNIICPFFELKLLPDFQTHRKIDYFPRIIISPRSQNFFCSRSATISIQKRLYECIKIILIILYWL